MLGSGDQPATANLKIDDTVAPQPSAPTTGTDQQQEARDAAEQDILDSLPLDDDFCSAEEFLSSNSSMQNDTDNANDDESIVSHISNDSASSNNET